MKYSARSPVPLLGALAKALCAVLWLASPGQAGEPPALTPVTDVDDLKAGCSRSDFGAAETFEGLVGVEIPSNQSNFAFGAPLPGYQFPSGIIFGGRDPNIDLTVVDMANGTVFFNLGDNGAISDPSVLPSGTAYAATNSSSAADTCFFLPPSNASCSAVGMYLSSFDGADVSLTAFDHDGEEIGQAVFATETALSGFIGVVGSGDRPIRGIQISSSEVYALDDIEHPVWNGGSYTADDLEMCPEPSAALLQLAALGALASLATRRG